MEKVFDIRVLHTQKLIKKFTLLFKDEYLLTSNQQLWETFQQAPPLCKNHPLRPQGTTNRSPPLHFHTCMTDKTPSFSSHTRCFSSSAYGSRVPPRVDAGRLSWLLRTTSPPVGSTQNFIPVHNFREQKFDSMGTRTPLFPWGVLPVLCPPKLPC